MAQVAAAALRPAAGYQALCRPACSQSPWRQVPALLLARQAAQAVSAACWMQPAAWLLWSQALVLLQGAAVVAH